MIQGYGGGNNLSNCISRAELDEISEGLIKGYINTKNQETRYVDIEDFIQSYLKLKIEYVSFADKDKSILGPSSGASGT